MKSRIQWLKTSPPIMNVVYKSILMNQVTSDAIKVHIKAIKSPWEYGALGVLSLVGMFSIPTIQKIMQIISINSVAINKAQIGMPGAINCVIKAMPKCVNPGIFYFTPQLQAFVF